MNDTLRKLGLNDKEIKIYLALLKTGKIRPANLASITKVNRATVYATAKTLLSKGIIAEDLGGSTLHLTPLPPESLSQLIEKPRRELENKEDLVKKAIADLSLITADKKYAVPKIRFVEEHNIEDFLYDNAVKWITALHESDGIWWSFQDHSFVEHYESFVEWVGNLKEYKDPRITSHILTNMAPIEEKVGKKIPRTKRTTRFVPGMNFTSSIWTSGDYMVMLVTQEHPFHLVEIHDKTLAHNMREVLKKLWSLTEEK
jgi:predicted transcriptional regulator